MSSRHKEAAPPPTAEERDERNRREIHVQRFMRYLPPETIGGVKYVTPWSPGLEERAMESLDQTWGCAPKSTESIKMEAPWFEPGLGLTELLNAKRRHEGVPVDAASRRMAEDLSALFS